MATSFNATQYPALALQFHRVLGVRYGRQLLTELFDDDDGLEHAVHVIPTGGGQCMALKQ